MKKLFSILTFICAQSIVLAQENAGTNRVVLTPQLVNELAEEARTNNAALWAARSRVKAAEENAKSLPRWRQVARSC